MKLGPKENATWQEANLNIALTEDYNLLIQLTTDEHALGFEAESYQAMVDIRDAIEVTMAGYRAAIADGKIKMQFEAGKA